MRPGGKYPGKAIGVAEETDPPPCLGGPAPRDWRDIPAVPTEAFRASVLACGAAARVFESSGTTRGLRRFALGERHKLDASYLTTMYHNKGTPSSSTSAHGDSCRIAEGTGCCLQTLKR